MAGSLHVDGLQGRVALVTGAGGGIGGAVARTLARNGLRLVLTDLRPEGIEALASELGGTEVLTHACDLTDEAAVQELFRIILDRFGRLDVAVNAAGVLKGTPFEQISKAEWDRLLNANAGSAFLVCRECCAPMRAQGWGRIVNFASLAAHVGGVAAGAHYAAGKAAVISLTRSVAKLLAPHGVRCNVIAPSAVDTGMLQEFGAEQQQRILAAVPIGRVCTPEEIAELVLFLVSPAADFITGQTIDINGGAYFG